MSRPHISFPDLIADPFGTLGAARRAHWLADADGATAVLTHERVRELLGDGRLHASFSDFLETFGVTSGPFYEWMARSPLNTDGAEHQRWRSLLSRTFTPRSVERLRPFLQTAAGELIDAVAPRGECEFMAEFADAYPSLGLCELIGVPVEDRDRFRDWANAIGLGFNPMLLVERIAEIDAALVALLEYTTELAARRRAAPRDDLVSRIAQAADLAGWAEDMIPASIAGLVFAGHETTKNQLGWMIAVLAERPDIWDGVAGGELGVPEVVEEVLRYRSTVTTVGRMVAEPVAVAGEQLVSGQRILCSLWSADHDEQAYPQPDTVDPHANATVPHLAFGHGAHHCLGAALARAELQEALRVLTARLTCPRLLDGATWKPPVGINGPETLPVAFGVR